MEPKIRCVHCNAKNSIKKGMRKTQRRGKIQKYFCKECGQFFTNDEGFYRMRNSEKNITQSLYNYYEGLSSRKCSRQLEIFTENKASHVSILEWMRRFASKVTAFTDTLKPILGDVQTSDETNIKTEGENHQFGIVMDTKTRFITSAMYWDKNGFSLTTKDIVALWKTSKEKKKPKIFKTDGHRSYKPAFTKTFYSRYNSEKVQWDRNVTSKTGKYNVLIERLNRTLKDRLKTMYGFKSRNSAPLLLTGWVAYYNFVRPHMGIGNMTPAEKAEIKLEIGDNKWLGLIRISSIN